MKKTIKKTQQIYKKKLKIIIYIIRKTIYSNIYIKKLNFD